MQICLLQKLFKLAVLMYKYVLGADPWIKTSSQEETVNWSIQVVPE